MLNNKNISPAKVALIIATILGILVWLIVFIIAQSFLHSFIASGTLFLCTYFLVAYAINQFVFRKIKLIYKFISQTKATKREEFYNQELLPQKTLDDVTTDVEVWANERSTELERLQNNEEFRREFLMNLAHELKTPIFSAQGFIETLLDGALDNPSVATSFLQKAGKSIDRLSDLVNDLDLISKMESNEFPLNKSRFVVQELFHDVFEELSQQAVSKHIKLAIKSGCERPIEVFADKQRIKQVVVNLIANSITYGKNQGETTAGVYEIDGIHVFVEITDDGIGISEDRVPRVFERFYRTDQARSRHAGGSGLGLAIVKHIIESHGHAVTCRSKLEVGTSFGFTLNANE
jgi:two-component system, OmpR family, phosphate regulon sensor histidine kinase PhoR